MKNKYTEYKSLNLVEISNHILDYWKENQTFLQSLRLREGHPPFIFYEGPPSANGKPGIHHVMARAIKDIFCRYKTQKGFYVERKAGWDTHGLPIELAVEQSLGITKEDIGVKISVDEYNQACRKEVMKYKDLWDDLTIKMGYWVDLDHPYITFENQYIETLWYLLAQMYKKGLLYKGYTIQPYSPAAGTGLSSHELNMPGCYKDVKDTTVVAQFKISSPSKSPQRGDLQRPGYQTAAKESYELLKLNKKENIKKQTEAESVLWTCLKGKKLEGFKFRRQHIIGEYIVDFVCLPKQLIIEVDGGYHNQPEIQTADKERTLYLENSGYKVIRFTNDEILCDIDNVISTIYTELEKRTMLKVSPLGGDLEGAYLLAWTTTPWTLPSNTALAVGPNIDYVLVKTFNAYSAKPIHVILAKALLHAHFPEKNAELSFEDYQAGDKNIPYQVVAECKGTDLIGIQYEQLIPWVNPGQGAFRVIAGDYVTTEDGTGIVHISPTFGADDDRVAKQAGVPPLFMYDREKKRQPMVDKTGKFYKIEDLDPDFLKNNVNIDLYKDFSGRYVKNDYDAKSETNETTLDIDLCVMLKQQNLAFKIEKHTHNYPHCWRTDKPILYYPLDSWFIRTTAVKNRLLALNKTIQWKPESTGSGRFGNWLENLVDWNLSRSRYWGTPLPIWRTDDGKEEICIESVAQLRQEIDKAVATGFMKENPYQSHDYQNFDLHRPYIDKVILVSPSGKKMTRELDLIDVWFDSGAMPYAQYFYPHNDISKSFPADFIAEGVDQTRGWFFTLHAIATIISDSVAYKNVISNGLVLDKNGNKMSKRLGNAVDPFETLQKYGPDATRWYMITNTQPWENLKFDLDGIDEVRRKFFGTLYNTYSFFALYANIDCFTYKEVDIAIDQRPEIDRWILSELNTLINNVDAYYADYEPTKAGRAIQYFVDVYLSNWYVRLSRRRFWKGEYNEDKISAYQTLYSCLETIAKLMAPIAPFFAEQLYRDLNTVSRKNTAESVHHSDFPQANSRFIDPELEQQMQLAQQISSMVLSLRKRNNIKVRQPLSKIIIPISDKNRIRQIETVKDLIMAEVNIKAIEYLSDDNNILVKKIKPNFKTLGPKYGKNMKAIAAAIAQCSQADINRMEKDKELCLHIEQEEIMLTIEDVEILTEDIPGWIVSTEDNITVALDINITNELKNEGIAREMVNRIQNIRKESDLDVIDKINVTISHHPEVEEVLLLHKDYICSEILCNQLTLVKDFQSDISIELSDTIILAIEVKKA
ncbi:MAG: isoleucine--tRNA ligase [Bacteroidales bacterium]|nr:isoleucine--tRNA ligase [Bacteroidales bacterium]MDD3331167.1 isoleucine--tRNA ligase [Bacteroidales bacterium]MDD4581960.1 isoleucine--tRNA ligase [Bacteroidales bacterium]